MFYFLNATKDATMWNQIEFLHFLAKNNEKVKLYYGKNSHKTCNFNLRCKCNFMWIVEIDSAFYYVSYHFDLEFDLQRKAISVLKPRV